jgi:hypothetical protein
MGRYYCTLCDYFEDGIFENVLTCCDDCMVLQAGDDELICHDCMQELMSECPVCGEDRCTFCYEEGDEMCIHCEEKQWEEEEAAEEEGTICCT